MKKFLFFLAAVIISSMTNAQNSSPYWSLSGNSNATTTSKLGTTNSVPLRFLTNNVERLRIDATGKIGVGTATPSGKFTIFNSGSNPAASWVTSGPPIFAGFGENTAGAADHLLMMASNVSNARPVFLGRKSRNTLASPSAVQNNDYLMSILASGYDGGNFQSPASIDVFVDGTTSGGNVPARISLVTGSNFSNRTERLKVGSTGNIFFNNNQLFVQQSNGFVGLGTTTPARKLNVVDGDFRIETSSPVARFVEFVKTGAPIDWRMEHSFSGNILYFSYSSNDFTSFRDRMALDTFSTDYGYGLQLFGKAISYSWDLYSDAKLKTNIADLSNATDVIARLKPHTYNFKQAQYPTLGFPSTKQYGLVAQELEKVLPELVTTSKMSLGKQTNGERQLEDVKSVNYVALIPLLIKGAQEQQQHIRKQDSLIQQQQQQIETLKTLVSKLTGDGASVFSGGSLGQNMPNPGGSSTRISYNLPLGAHRARLAITDNNGKTITSVQLNSSGMANINTASLSVGVYNYSLVVDDRIVDTRQMIIAR